MSIKDEISTISEETGLSKEKISSIMEDWALPLMRKGIIVKLKISYWRAKTSIGLHDVGLDNDEDEWLDFSNKYINLGKKYLLPPHAINLLNQVETRSRRNLKNHSYETIWGDFVPFSAYFEWKEKNEIIKEEFYEVAAKIRDDYSSLKEEAKKEYKKHAKIIHEKEDIKSSYEFFEKEFLKNLEYQIISSQSFFDSCKYEVFNFFIPLPSQVEKEILQTEEFHNKREEVEKERELRQRVIEETSRMKTEYIERFLDSTVGEIRNMVFTIVKEVKNSFNDEGASPIVGVNRKKLLNMINKVRTLDFYDDSQIRNMLDQLQIDLEKDKADRSEDEVIKTLGEIEDTAKAGIHKVIGNRFKLVDLS